MNRKAFHIRFSALLAFVLWLGASNAFSQNVFSSEDDLKKQANKLFEDEDFTKAYPLFSQLLSLYPKDPQYNYKFGTCLLFSSSDKSKAIPYIEFAAKRQKQDVDKEVFFYLGKAYHLNYRFSDAIRLYTLFKSVASSKQQARYDVDRQIEMCENGKRLLKNVTDLSVLEKKEVPEADFFRSYNLSEFSAKLIVKPEDLKTSFDKKKKDNGLMYLDPSKSQIYFSSYGDDGKNGKDIYYVNRTPSGDLSKPIRVSDVINTKYDEDFPFLHPNGKILYFCSKGHNSMGGYDVFKSEWNDASQSWGKPVNMDFAINTPDDDILFISDSEDKSAYFSSRRESALGMMMVYKIKLDRKPLDLSLIKGTLTKTVGDKIPNAKITVTKVLKDEVVGVFNTNSADGSYALHLPNGGKFMFTVESSGFKKSSELVVVPFQQEIKPLKQEISLVNENDLDKVVIKNDFDAQVDSADMELALQYIKSKASLDVSPAEELITSTAVEETTATSAETKTETQVKNSVQPVTNADIIGMAYDDAKETQKDANEMVKNSDAAQKLANQKNDLAVQKNKEADELMRSSENITNQEEKLAQVDKANKMKKESEALSKEAAFALTLSNQMADQAKAKQEQADAELKYAKDLESTIKLGANEKKMNELLVQKEALDKKGEILKAPFPPDLSKEAAEKQTEASKLMAKYLDTQQDVEDSQKESQRLRSEAAKTSSEAVKNNLIQQAEDLEKELEVKKKKAEDLNTQAKQLQSKADSLKNSASLTASVMKEIKSESATTASENTVKPKNTKIVSTVVNENPTTATSTETKTQAAATNTVTATEPAPLVITSHYADVYLNLLHEAEKKPKELDREEEKAFIYQSWTDSLDQQIASLKKLLDKTTIESHKTQIQNKIYELQSSVDDKRQKAADSRKNADNLKLKEALAAASNITPENTAVSTNTVTPSSTNTVAATTTTTVEATSTNTVTASTTNSTVETSTTNTVATTSTNTVTSTTTESPVQTNTATATAKTESTTAPENLTGTENINDYYEKQLAASTSGNEYEKKVKEQQIYQDWSSALYDESQRLKKDGKNKKAEVAEMLSKNKQTLASQTADKVTEIKADHPDWVEAAKTKQPETVTASSQTTAVTETKSEWPVKVVTPETTAVATNTVASTPSVTTTSTVITPTVTASNPVTTETVSTTKTETVPVKTETSTQPSTTSTVLSVNPPESVKNKDEYIHYVALRNEADWLKKNSERRMKQADDMQKISEEQLSESKKVKVQLANTTNADEQQKLRKKAEGLEKKSLRNKEKADSIKVLVKNSQAEANSKLTESDLFLQGLDKSDYEEITAATGHQPRTQTTVYATNPAATKTVTPETTTASTETKIETTNQPSTTEKTTTQATNTVLPTTTASTETKSTEKNVTHPKTENKTIATKTVSPVTTTETKTETATQPTATKTESATTATSPATKAALLKYYDALFDKLELAGAPYSANKPIPVDAPLPEGLVYKIQIGAFKNPIPQDLFKGLKPIMAETTPQGYKRYTAGIFQKFTAANQAKTQVNNLGYRDAFIVAFFNGKRISLNEAMNKAKESGENVDLSTASSVVATTTTTTQPVVNPETNTATATDVKNVGGLFYAIQIGVFSKPVSSTQLYNISPLNSESTEKGLIRYTTGRFTSEANAVKARNNIAGKGIADAFIVAYHNGKRISLAAAKNLIDTQGANVISKDKQEYSFVPSDTTTSESSAVSLTTSSNKGIVFKVQVGAYKEKVPIGEANKLLKISDKGIKTFKDENGLMIYTVGEFLEYETANKQKEQIISQGVTGAFVIAIKNGKKIPASEALDLIKNK